MNKTNELYSIQDVEVRGREEEERDEYLRQSIENVSNREKVSDKFLKKLPLKTFKRRFHK